LAQNLKVILKKLGRCIVIADQEGESRPPGYLGMNLIATHLTAPEGHSECLNPKNRSSIALTLLQKKLQK
jgi:hypothetical protein